MSSTSARVLAPHPDPEATDVVGDALLAVLTAEPAVGAVALGGDPDDLPVDATEAPAVGAEDRASH